MANNPSQSWRCVALKAIVRMVKVVGHAQNDDATQNENRGSRSVGKGHALSRQDDYATGKGQFRKT